MFSHLSSKRGTAEIGRFGLGFKSVLGVTDSPEFFSRSGSFRFDREAAREKIQSVAPDATRYPALRLPEAIDPGPEMESDPVLRELTGWATNIVRLPLKPGARESLLRQANDFPPEFLLFVEHVSELAIQANDEIARAVSLRREGGYHILSDGDNESRWMLVRGTHELSGDAKADGRSLDDATEVAIWWTAPVDRPDDSGHFWAFFPTQTSSLLAGILNAPWKTNEDRQNLLEGVYNNELIDAAAVMVAKVLTKLSNEEDPARHLDALPRRFEPGDNKHSQRLRDQLYSRLLGREIVPDQHGVLRRSTRLNYAPSAITNPRQEAALARWQSYEKRPTDWAHHRVLTRIRMAKLDELQSQPIQRASVAEWLGALVKEAKVQQRRVKAAVVAHRTPHTSESNAQMRETWYRPIAEASMAAVQTAAQIPEAVRLGKSLGEIVLTADESWIEPNPDTLFLGGGLSSGASTLVHPMLESDAETLSALKTLGIAQLSKEAALKTLAARLLVYRWYHRVPPSDKDWHEFWRLAREVDQKDAAHIIQSYEHWRVRYGFAPSQGNGISCTAPCYLALSYLKMAAGTLMSLSTRAFTNLTLRCYVS